MYVHTICKKQNQYGLHPQFSKNVGHKCENRTRQKSFLYTASSILQKNQMYIISELVLGESKSSKR